VNYDNLLAGILEDFAEHQTAHMRERRFEAIALGRREPGARARRRPEPRGERERRTPEPHVVLAYKLRAMRCRHEGIDGSWLQQTAAIAARTRAQLWDASRETAEVRP
jgi:hypothetical protein